MKGHRVMNSRAQAAGIVREWMDTGMFPDRLIGAGIRDRAFVMEAVYGVVRQKRKLEWVIGRCSDRRPDAGITHIPGWYRVLIDARSPSTAVNCTVSCSPRRSVR